MGNRGRRATLLAACPGTLLAALLLVTGCAATPAPHAAPHSAKTVVGASHPTSAAASPSAASELADAFLYLPPAGTVMGTGTLAPVNGQASGEVAVSVATDLRFQVSITGFATSAGPGLTVALSVDRFGVTAGEPIVPAVDDPVGTLEATSGDAVLPFDSSGRRDRGNLSYFNSVELVSDGTVIAAAPIAWSIPDFYPGLTLKDSGPAPYARGTVTSYAGQPASYAVWGNDNSQAVATRFGITQDQLFYLNPQLRRGDTTLLRDTRLNLSVAYR
jgi:hypothetical protein